MTSSCTETAHIKVCPVRIKKKRQNASVFHLFISSMSQSYLKCYAVLNSWKRTKNKACSTPCLYYVGWPPISPSSLVLALVSSRQSRILLWETAVFWRLPKTDSVKLDLGSSEGLSPGPSARLGNIWVERQTCLKRKKPQLCTSLKSNNASWSTLINLAAVVHLEAAT